MSGSATYNNFLTPERIALLGYLSLGYNSHQDRGTIPRGRLGIFLAKECCKDTLEKLSIIEERILREFGGTLSSLFVKVRTRFASLRKVSDLELFFAGLRNDLVGHDPRFSLMALVVRCAIRAYGSLTREAAARLVLQLGGLSLNPTPSQQKLLSRMKGWIPLPPTPECILQTVDQNKMQVAFAQAQAFWDTWPSDAGRVKPEVPLSKAAMHLHFREAPEAARCILEGLGCLRDVPDHFLVEQAAKLLTVLLNEQSHALSDDTVSKFVGIVMECRKEPVDINQVRREELLRIGWTSASTELDLSNVPVAFAKHHEKMLASLHDFETALGDHNFQIARGILDDLRPMALLPGSIIQSLSKPEIDLAIAMGDYRKCLGILETIVDCRVPWKRDAMLPFRSLVGARVYDDLGEHAYSMKCALDAISIGNRQGNNDIEHMGLAFYCRSLLRLGFRDLARSRIRDSWFKACETLDILSLQNLGDIARMGDD